MSQPAGASPDAGGAPRWHLRPTVELFPASDGDIYLLRPGERPVVVRRPDAADRRLLEALSTGTLAFTPESDEGARLQPLIDADVLVCARDLDLAAEDASRFARQVGYLAELGDAGSVQRRLRGATVAIVGCGGVGTWALGALAALGIGRFVLVDDDRIELSNLNRQVIYREADIGALKVERAAAWLRAFDPHVEVAMVPARVTSAQALDEMLPASDLLIMAADSPPHELSRWVNRVAVERRMPFATAGLQAPLVRVGPIYCPGKGPCYTCHETQSRRGFPLYEELAEHQNSHPPGAITTGPAAGIVGSLIANDSLNLLAVGRPATMDQALILDLRDLRFRWERVRRDDRCPTCSALFG